MNTPLDSNSRPSRALVLSGGGGRGAFQCGVLEKLTELGWRPDILVGTSIGSMNAAVWALDGTPGVSRMWDELRTRDMHRFLRRPPWRSLFDRDPWKRTLEKYAPEDRLRQVTTPLYIVATDITTGHPTVYTNSRDLDAAKPLYQTVEAITHAHLLASSAIPYVYPQTPVARSDHWDGAVMYNSPLRPAIDAGAEEIFVVLLSPYHDLLSPGESLPPSPRDLAGKLGYVLDLAITATFENDFEQMRKINRRVRRGATLAADHKQIKCAVIGPRAWITPLDIIRYRPDRTAALRQMGRDETERTWDRVQKGWDSLHGLE
ncbi:MAG TPA: patatin-like phospholipase family protein [Anaerolineae bacterium]|nr:patatin-like phospholipase family protein [Anaerolineae bacterium]